MEQYTINKPNSSSSIIEGMYFMRIHQRHVESYGKTGANNIVQNVRATYIKLMQQLYANPSGNHNSLLVGKVQSGKTSNLELLSALAFDNGYNFLLILGGMIKIYFDKARNDLVELLTQLAGLRYSFLIIQFYSQRTT